MDERLAQTIGVLAAFVNHGGDLEETLSELLGLGAAVVGSEMATLTIRDQSQSENRKLREIAAEVVSRQKR